MHLLLCWGGLVRFVVARGGSNCCAAERLTIVRGSTPRGGSWWLKLLCSRAPDHRPWQDPSWWLKLLCSRAPDHRSWQYPSWWLKLLCSRALDHRPWQYHLWWLKWLCSRALEHRPWQYHLWWLKLLCSRALDHRPWQYHLWWLKWLCSRAPDLHMFGEGAHNIATERLPCMRQFVCTEGAHTNSDRAPDLCVCASVHLY